MTEELLPLRERKRMRTRRHIEEVALRLFVEQGYERTTVIEIAQAAEVAERTFFLHFASKEDVVLGDIADELETMAKALAERPADRTVLQIFRELGDRRVNTFLDRAEQVRARRAIEQANPNVHARAVAVREEAEHRMLSPEFARDLRLPEGHTSVTLLVAAFTGVSAALDGMFDSSPDRATAREILDQAITALEALESSLRQG